MTRAPRLATFAACLIAASPVLANSLRQTLPSTTKSTSIDGTSLDDLRVTARLDEIRRQRDAYEGQQLVAKAVKEVRAGRDEAAEALFARAVQLDDSNKRALDGLRETRERLGLLTNPSALIDRAAKQRRVEQQEAQFRFEAAIADAQRGINSGKPEGFQAAKLAILRAKQVRSECAGAFSPDQLMELDGRLRDHDLQLNKAVQKRDDAERQAQQDEWRRRIKEARVHDITLD
jgi:hypothetical protein